MALYCLQGMPPLLVVYRYGSVVFAGSHEDQDLALTDTFVPLAVRYKAVGDSESTMTWRGRKDSFSVCIQYSKSIFSLLMLLPSRLLPASHHQP
jgi:hypothetical protein